MSLDALKQEAASLDEKSQVELLVFLATLREERWANRLQEASKKLDDPKTEWLSGDEFWARVDKVPPPSDD